MTLLSSQSYPLLLARQRNVGGWHEVKTKNLPTKSSKTHSSSFFPLPEAQTRHLFVSLVSLFPP
jgi:hypothetical protein